MKILEAGPLRHLLFNPAEIERNRQRGYQSTPVVLVAEAGHSATLYYTGYGMLADGPVAAVYNPTKQVLEYRDQYTGRRVPLQAAFVTTGRIALAESAEEAATLELMEAMDDVNDVQKPAATEQQTKRPSAKQPTVKKPEEGTK